MGRFLFSRFWLPLTVVLLTGFMHFPAGSGVAHAGETAAQAEAKSHFRTGLRLYKEGAYEAALVEFQESYRLGKRASALRNVAQCQRDLRDFAAAHGSLERLLAEHASGMERDERKDVARALSEVAQLTGFIEVKVSVAGAAVEVDGKALGESPLAGQVRANVGVHRIRATKAGYEPFEGSATVVAERNTAVDVNLLADIKTGHVLVRSRGETPVPVLVDGTQVGMTPWEGELPPGQHTIQLKSDTSSSEPLTVNVVLRSKHEVTLDALPEMGSVELRATPAGATILVDEAVVGRGSWTGDLLPGKHAVRVSYPGLQTQTIEIEVSRGRTLTRSVGLVPEPVAAASVAPPEKEEWDGLYLGLGLNVDVIGKAGEHPDCPDNSGGTCREMKPLGGALIARFGYSFGFIGPELVAGARFQMYEDSREFQDLLSHRVADSPYLPYAYERKEVFRSYDLGVYVGLGPRLATKGPVRLTVGTALGVNMRSFTMQRRVTNGTVDFSTSYTAPSLMFDAGVMLGSTPGAKAYVGFLGQADFPQSDVTATDHAYYEDVQRDGAPTFQGPAPVYKRASGTQFFFGPIVGVQFGH